MSRAGTPDPAKRLRRQLKKLYVWPPGQAKTIGLAYQGPADFVLQHGEPFPPRPLPGEYRRGLQKKCFANAINFGIVYGLDYVEGYAIGNPELGGNPRLPIHHAWNVDADGQLVDTTWWLPGIAYLGVRFSVERADDATWNGDATVLDDWIRRWPLLKEPWHGEPEGLEWPPSQRLAAIRRFRDGDLAGARALAKVAFKV